MMDDWGCVKEEDSFFSSGTQKSLDELVESLVSKSGGIDADFGNSNIFSLANGISKNVEIVSYADDRPTATGFAPKILKKTTGVLSNDMQRQSLKRVTFEVEKFAAEECGNSSERNDARARLALQLGAKPVKKPYMNYKALKAKLVNDKLAAKDGSKQTKLCALRSAVMRKKGTKTKKNRK